MVIFWAKKVQFLPFFEGENFRGSRALKMILRPGIKRSRRDLSKYMLKTTFGAREPRKFWPNFFRQILNVLPPYLRFWPKSWPFFWRVPGLQKWFWARESRDLKKFSWKHVSELLSDPGNPKNFWPQKWLFFDFRFSWIFWKKFFLVKKTWLFCYFSKWNPKIMGFSFGKTP